MYVLYVYTGVIYVCYIPAGVIYVCYIPTGVMYVLYVYTGVISVNMTDSFMNAGSYWNKMRPDQGLEGASCFQSGSESDSFWKIALPDVVTISKVIINGRWRSLSLCLKII